MTAFEISELTRNKQPMPHGLNLTEMKLFTVLENIYRSYDAGYITLDEAKRRKSTAMKEFENDELGDRVRKETVRRNLEISRLYSKENQCPICRKAFNIFSGIIQDANGIPPSEYDKKVIL